MEENSGTKKIKKIEDGQTPPETFSQDQISEVADLLSEGEKPKDDDTGKFPAFREEDMKPTEE